MKIGPYELSSPFVLAPMVGVTDAPFRRICRKFGAGLTTSEMTTADTSLWQTDLSRRRLDIDLDAEPIAVQIAGSDPRRRDPVVAEVEVSTVAEIAGSPFPPIATIHRLRVGGPGHLRVKMHG